MAYPAAELGVSAYIESQYYESRLASGLEQQDYLISFSQSAARRVSDRLGAFIDGYAGGSSGWQALQRLLAAWADPQTNLGMYCPTIWFEYDDIGARECRACPSVSICITRSYRADESHSPFEKRDLELCREALAVLGADLTAAQGTALPTAFDELPPGARMIYVSYMLGRSTPAIKLYGVLRRDQLLGYLQRIGWAGDQAQITHALGLLYPPELLGEELYFDLNLDDFRDPARCTLGLAVAQQHLFRGADPDPTRSKILELWTKAGLCTAEKVRRARTWPGSAASVAIVPFEREYRFLDVKLVWRAGSGFVAKSYLGRQRLRGLFN